MLKHSFVALVMLLLVVPDVKAAPVSVQMIDWGFYQYGLVSGPTVPNEFEYIDGLQSTPAGVASVVGISHEGTWMESEALLWLNESSSLDSYSLSVNFSILARALVDPANLNGSAQAGGSLNLLGTSFLVSEAVLATLETSAASTDISGDHDWSSTSLVEPGECNFLYSFPSGIDAEAATWGPGFASAEGSHYFNFTFTKVADQGGSVPNPGDNVPNPGVNVPAPGVFLLFGMGLLGIAVGRGRMAKS